MNIFCPKCGTENTSGVRFCRNCGVEIEAVAALLEGRLVVSDEGEGKGFFGKRSWEKALIAFSLGVVLLILGFILGFDHTTGSPTPGLGLLLLAFPLIGFGVGQMVKLSSDSRDQVKVRPAAQNELSMADTKELPASETEYVSPEVPRERREAELAPPSVIESTTRNLDKKEEAVTRDLEDPADRPLK